MGQHDISDKEKTFRTQFGQSASVNRETVSAENAAKANRQLIDLGLHIQTLDNFPKAEHTYLGSAAVHVYWNETLKVVFFASQTQPLDLYRCPEPLAAKAFDDLLRTMKTMYGHRVGKLRSGF